MACLSGLFSCFFHTPLTFWSRITATNANTTKSQDDDIYAVKVNHIGGKFYFAKMSLLMQYNKLFDADVDLTP